ncbi:MAG TPA: transcription-repair coupling factor [Actinomycetes bacterium]|nr:transcription-repair coupling factor [Actinomycetes bacterium]
MSLSGLLDLVSADPAVAQAIELARSGARHDLDLTAPVGYRPFVIGSLVRGADRPILAVTATSREGEDLTSALATILPPERIAYFPSWETLPHERLSPRSDTVGRRLAVLRRLAHPSDEDAAAGPLSVVVAPIRSVIQPMVSGLGDLRPVSAGAGTEISLDDLIEDLVHAAYTRVDLVEKRGEFAVRGGIVDVFPPTEEHPLRVEFWGDEIEEIRYFKVADQRSLEVAEHGLWAPPCRELLLTPAVRDRAAKLREQYPELDEILGKIAEGVSVEGMEALSPVLTDEMVLLSDQLPAGTHVVVCDPERVRTRAGDLVRTSQEFLDASWANAAAGAKAPIDLGAATLRGMAEIREHAREISLPWWSLTPFPADPELARAAVGVAADGETTLTAARGVDMYRGDTARALADVKGWLGAGWRVVMVTEGHGPAERLAEVLKGQDVPARVEADLANAPDAAVVHIAKGLIDHGFVAPDLQLAVLTEEDIAGQRSSTRDMRLPSRRRNMVDPLQLRPGDFVVHEQHGVGRYVEMAQRTVQGATREYLVIEYAPSRRGQPGDRLYVPTDQLELVTKYVGGEQPTVHRLGGADWQKAKGRARRAVREIAAELIRLYAARTASPGFAFGPDTPWQRELEDAFPYVETPDQLAAIEEVKADMRQPYPMDRLISGDVGYGKTEIAVRAAFKAVQDGKQVAVLVPTTLLVQQHISTFGERYANFPIVVRPLSRFQTDKEADEVVRGLADGSIDIVIGTHRLLSAGVSFKDLGLVIVDEEQRFGVEQKEHLKALRASVDVLSMSATPIPRTLEMAITGIREMSTIATPPEERHPVLTFVGPYDDKQIAAAIRRELLREGQIFYIHNRVETIQKAASRLRDLVPEARIEVAHGQMNEHVLERLIVAFWEKEFDVLVCTTIVESGLDIANANTLILERADLLGLAQLHQLRGRVGRGRERAYSYFLYPQERPLTETAHERLATIAQHSELGAGMYVAMKDLEIRGAGNLLGGEQSGHIAAVGFDLYVRLVGEAVAEFKDDGKPARPETKVELPIDAHIPHDYIESERLRLEAYKRMASIESDEGVDEVRAELLDRYGDLPEPVANLLDVARFRTVAASAGVAEVTAQGNFVRFAPVELPESGQLRLQRLYPKSLVKPAVRTILVPRPTTAAIGGQPLRDTELLKWATKLVTDVLTGESLSTST